MSGLQRIINGKSKTRILHGFITEKKEVLKLMTSFIFCTMI